MPLPGQESHYKMTSSLRLKELKNFTEQRLQARKAGVLMLFYPKQSLDTSFVLIHRKSYPGVHSNQVGFPGGKVERSDKDLRETALRETFEEVGVPPSQIQVIRPLTDVYIPPSNFLVSPYLGFTREEPSFIPEEAEVEQIIEVPLAEFLHEKAVFETVATTSYASGIQVPAFKLRGYTVWGATAMMLNEVKELLNTAITRHYL